MRNLALLRIELLVKWERTLKIMEKFLLVIFILFAFVSSQAQQPVGNRQKTQSDSIGIIRGHIFDKQTKQPIEFASIAVYDQRDSTLKTGAITDNMGKFEVSDLPFGKYFLVI